MTRPFRVSQGDSNPVDGEPSRTDWRRQTIAEVVADATSSDGDPDAYCEYLAVDTGLVVDISEIAGVDVGDYVHAVDVSTVRHILKRHGPTGRANRSVTIADFERLPAIVGRPDSIRACAVKGTNLEVAHG